MLALKEISLKDEDIVVKKLALTQDWHQGLGARATMSMITGYFYKEKKKNKTHQASLASSLIPHHLLIAYTQQVEILVPALPYCYLDPQKPSKKDVVWITILILPLVGVTQ